MLECGATCLPHQGSAPVSPGDRVLAHFVHQLAQCLDSTDTCLIKEHLDCILPALVVKTNKTKRFYGSSLPTGMSPAK